MTLHYGLDSIKMPKNMALSEDGKFVPVRIPTSQFPFNNLFLHHIDVPRDYCMHINLIRAAL